MLQTFTTWLLGWIPNLVINGYNLLIDFFQILIDGSAAGATAVLSIWPSGSALPAGLVIPSGSVWALSLQAISWVLPLTYFAALIAFLVVGITAYFTIAPVARWFNLIT